MHVEDQEGGGRKEDGGWRRDVSVRCIVVGFGVRWRSRTRPGGEVVARPLAARVGVWLVEEERPMAGDGGHDLEL